MAFRPPHPQTIFHLVPKNDKAKAMLSYPDNQQYISLSEPPPRPDDPKPPPEQALEIGYHVPVRSRPEVITEVGRNADLILPGSSISAVQFSFETHPESKVIMFYDRSRHRNTTIGPSPFRTDGNLRQQVLQPGTPYEITAGGVRGDLCSFEVWWMRDTDAQKRVESGYQMAEERSQNPRWARTVDEGASELSSWYNTRLHTPSDGGVQRTIEGEELGEGAFGKVRKALDIDSGSYVAVKKIVLPKTTSGPSNFESLLSREVKTLASLSHKNIVEYLGSTGWGTDTLCIYTSLKSGNVSHMVELYPSTRSQQDILEQLLRQMLEALDYLAFRGLCHRDVKPDNILYTPINDHECLFQLADFGFANQKDLAHTYCGSPMFMAPEMYYHSHPQTPKLDVWSLFVTIASIIYPAEFDSKRFRHYEEILGKIRITVPKMLALSPMAREDPALRASAAQMLVQCFGGNGLSTPRGQIGPIPVPGDGPSRLQGPGPSDTRTKARARVDANTKHSHLASPLRSTNRRGKAHSGPSEDRVREGERSIPGAFLQFS